MATTRRALRMRRRWPALATVLALVALIALPGASSAADDPVVDKLQPTVDATLNRYSVVYDGTQRTVEVTVHVTGPAGQPAPTGDVAFNGPGFWLTASVEDLATSAVLLTMPANPGTWPIEITYQGDANYDVAEAFPVFIIEKLTPTVTITPGPAIFGQPTSVVVNVTGPLASKRPTGRVIMSKTSGSDGDPIGADGTLASDIEGLRGGRTRLSASYLGDDFHHGVIGYATVVVERATPAVTVAVDPVSGTFGDDLTATVTVTGPVPAIAPVGDVTITTGSGTVTATLDDHGRSTVTLPRQTAGAREILATYEGDTDHDPASASTSATLGRATPTLDVTTGGAPTPVGEPVTATVAVTGPDPSMPPTGAVTVGTEDGDRTAVLDDEGRATVDLGTFPVGDHHLTISYVGDDNHGAVDGTAEHTVTTRPLVLRGVPDQATVRDELTVEAEGFLPGETITLELHSDPITLATVTADALGAATLTVTVPDAPPGEHRMVATGGTSRLSIDAALTVLARPLTTTTAGATTSTTTVPAVSPAAAAPPAASPHATPAAPLARTGSAVRPLAALGITLFAAGLAVFGAANRRRQRT